MDRSRYNDLYLPGALFPDALQVTTNIDDALIGAEDVLIVVPSHALRETLERLKNSSQPIKHLAWATKGFETETGLLPHQVVRQVVGTSLPMAVILSLIHI